ncbi:MAG: PKD domain-containing protein, partial [Bacteroidota bacterium]
MKLENFRSICWLLLGWTCGVFGQNENTNGRWSDPVPFGIVPVAVANLPDGRLICWSSQFRNTFIGNGDGATFTELFDPFVGTDGQALGEFTSNTDHDMFCPGINNLADGRILAAGGTSSERTSIYDWRTGVWSVADEMNIPRGYQGNVTLPNGSVFTVGGSWSGGAWTNRDAEIWTSASGWQLLPGIKGDDFYTFNDLLGDSQSPLYRADNHIWLWPAPDGNLFHAGPSRQMHWINTSGNGTMIAAGARGNDSFSMKGTTVMFDVGKILKVGGAVSYDDGDPANNTSYVIDINSGYGNNPTVTATSNTLTFARTMHNSTVLPNGQVLVTGGISDASLFTDTGARLTAELYDPTTNSWATVAGMQTPRTYHSVAILMVDGRVFVGGGGLCDSTPGCVNHFDAEIYSPPYLFDTSGNLAQRPVISAPSVANYNTSVPVTGSTGIQSFSLVRFSAATHSTNNEQRRIPVSFSSFGQSYSVNIPNQNLLPPGYYMLFAIDGDGVPSIAETIQIGQGLQDPQNNDLLVQLDFEENAGITVSDSAGNNDFTVAERNDNGAPVTANDHQWNASGVFGDALELDGKFHTSNTLLELPYNNDIAQLEDAVTVTAWVWRDAGSIVSQTGRPANVAVFAHDYPAIFAGFHNSLLKWSFGTTDGFVDCYAGHAPLNQWMHIAVTYDGRDAKLYSNGIEICSKPIRGKIRLRNDSSPNSRFTISGFYEHRTNLPVVPYGNRSGITDEVDGRIDDFRIYKTALSETEIQSIYNLGLIANVPGISDCSTQRIVPEYKIGPNGQWREGNVIEALKGSQVFIRAKNYPGEYFITTPQYDGPTFSSVNSTSRLTAEGAYQVDTYVYHFNNPERNDGLIDRSNVGQFALTTTGGCSTVINLQLEISNENCETEIIPEYRLNGVWQSGENDLTVEVGTEVVLSMLPNTISVEIELPSGQTVGDNFSLGQVTAVDSGTYKLISEEGCIDFINLTVNDPNGNQPPIANATGSPLSGTFPLLVNFNGGDSTDDTGISSYSWDFGDGNGSSSTSPSHTYTAAGSYVATLTVTDAEGLTDNDTVTIMVTGGSGGGCDPLTAPWASQDIGGVGQAGSSCYDAATGIYEIEGSGSDIWGTSD